MWKMKVQKCDCSIKKSLARRVRFPWRSKERNVACARLWVYCWCDPVCASDSHWRHACGLCCKKFCICDGLVHNQLPRSRSNVNVICHLYRWFLNTLYENDAKAEQVFNTFWQHKSFIFSRSLFVRSSTHWIGWWGLVSI